MLSASHASIIQRLVAYAGTLLLTIFGAVAYADGAYSAQECAEQVKMMGPESSFNFYVSNFVSPSAQCKDKQSVHDFCVFVQSYDGYKTLADDAPLIAADDPEFSKLGKVRDLAAKLCGTTTHAIRAALCGQADKNKQWKYAYAECPAEGKQIFLRECLKPRPFIGEGMNGKLVQMTEAECTERYKSRTKDW